MSVQEKFTKKLPRIFDEGDPLKDTRQTYWIELQYSIGAANSLAASLHNKVYVIRDGEKIPESHWNRGVGMMNLKVYSALGNSMKRTKIVQASMQDLDEWRLRVRDLNSRERTRSKSAAKDAERRKL